MDPKDDTKITSGLAGGQVGSVTDEPTQVNPSISSEPVTDISQSSVTGVGAAVSEESSPMPAVTTVEPASETTTVGPSINPNVGLSQEEPVVTSTETPMVGNEAEVKPMNPVASTQEPTGGVMPDDTNDSSGGISNL